jgi:glycine cleavage system H protein
MSEQYKNYKQIFWVQKEDTIHTIGLNEDGLEDFEHIESVDLPSEGESVDAGAVCGSIETDKGPIDIYSPITGNVLEVNSLVIEEPSLIQDDPYDAWLIKIESEEDMSEEDEEEDDEDYDEDEEDNEEDDFDEDEDEEEK